MTSISNSSCSSFTPSSYSEAFHLFYAQQNTSSFLPCLDLLPLAPEEEVIKLICFIAEENLFECTCQREAFILLTPKLTPEAQEKIGNHLFLSPDKPAQEALWWGVYSKNSAVIQEAIQKGAKINQPIYPGMTALLLACKQADTLTASLLLDAGANPRFIGGTHHHQTPLSEALLKDEFKGSLALQKLTKRDDGFTEEFHAQKRLAHEFPELMNSQEISVLEGVGFYLEGYRPRYIFNREETRLFYQQLQKEILTGSGPTLDPIIGNLSPELQEKLKHPEVKEKLHLALQQLLLTFEETFEFERKGYHQRPSILQKELKSRLADSKPIVLFGVTRALSTWTTGAPNSHAWGIVISKDYASDRYIFLRCNRGFGSDPYPGVCRAELSEEEIYSLIDEYTCGINWKHDVFTPGQILFNVEAKMNEIGLLIFSQSKQTIGNCCHYSAISIELALLSVLLEPIFEDEHKVLAHTIQQQSTAHLCKTDLRKYIIKHLHQSELNHENFNLLELFYSRISSISSDCFEMYATSLAWQQHIKDKSLKAVWETLFEQLRESGVPSICASAEEIRNFLNAESNQELLSSITHLELSNLNLYPLPEELGRLNNLECLEIKQCNLQLTPQISFFKLKKLVLIQNRFISTPSLSFPQLKQLNLGCNYLDDFSSQSLLPILPKLYSNHDMVSENPSMLRFPQLEHSSIKDNEFPAIPHLHVPLHIQNDSFNDETLKGIFLGRLRGSELLSNEMVTNLILQFLQIEDPFAQAKTLESISHSSLWNESVAQSFFAEIPPEKIASIADHVKNPNETNSLVRSYISCLIRTRRSVDLLSEQQLEALLALFKTINGPSQSMVLQYIANSWNRKKDVCMRFFNAMEETDRAAWNGYYLFEN